MESSSSSTPAPRSRGPGGIQRPILWTCGILLVLGICACAVVGLGSIGFISYFGAEPEGLTVVYDMPQRVENGAEFELVLTLSNTSGAVLHVGDIDLDEAFGGSILDGAIVLETDPRMEKDYSIPGIKTFVFDRDIPAGASQDLIFTLRATTAGEHGGSVGVYVGDRAVRIETVTITVTEH